MPTATPVTLSAPSGQRVRGGYFAPGAGGVLTGVAAAAEAVASGGVSSVAPGTPITSLKITSTTAGTLPFTAAVAPLRGQVPTGYILESSGTPLGCSVLSRHDDDSAALVLVSGFVTVGANGTSTLALQTGTTVAAALTVAAITARVTSVNIDFGPYGTATLNTAQLGSPERVWWQDSGVICARYRLAAPSPAGTALEAVIDIHGYADRAHVEVVIENGKVNPALTITLRPATAVFSTIGVSVNGGTTVNITPPVRGTSYEYAGGGYSPSNPISPTGTEWTVLGYLNDPPVSPTTGQAWAVSATPTGAWVGQAGSLATWSGSAWVFTPSAGIGQVAALASDEWPGVWTGSGWVGGYPGRLEPSRALRTSLWVGAANPGLRVHQAVADLQQHPLLFKMDQAASVDLSGYGADSYVPLGFGRHRASGMGGGADSDGIGALTQWDARWLQSGDARVAHSVDVQGQTALHYNFNWRHHTSGRVPNFTEVDGKSWNGGTVGGQYSWPNQSNAAQILTWELMHHPAVGLAAFLSRPSPVFIELAQKVALWNAMYVTNFDLDAVQPTGIFRGGASTIRGRAWGIRSLAHAVFLTPDGDPWKAPAVANLAANVAYFDGYRTNAKSKLGVMWEGDPDAPQNVEPNAAGGPAFGVSGWFVHYFITEIHKVASARLLTGAAQTQATALADWACSFPVRWVNEQPNGGYRSIPYRTMIGRNATTIDMPDTWAEMRDYVHSDDPSALAGPWAFATGVATSYTHYNAADSNRPRYVDYFWAALVAAVERGVPGSRAAWDTVQRQVTNLTAWRAGFGIEPRWGSTPKQIGESYGVIDTATTALASGAWLNVTSSTNMAVYRDSTPNGDTDIAPLEGSGAATNQRPLMNWGGNITFRPTSREIVAVGATNGFLSDSPSGSHTAELKLNLTTGLFSRTWAPFAANTAHQYDANSTTDSPRGALRRALENAGLYRRSAAGTWAYVDHTGSGKMGISTAFANSAEFHPRLGSQGSYLVLGFNGALGRFDEATQVQTQVSAGLSGIGDNGIAAYHPAIDAVLVGYGDSASSIYSVGSNGTPALFTTNMPAGVTSISCRDVVNAVLAPDPQGRAFAWLYDLVTTRKVWRLDLTAKTWADMGAIPAGVAAQSCVATVGPLGLHVILSSGGGGRSGGATLGAVWAYRPA